MKPLNIAAHSDITVSPERLRSDLGIAPKADFAAVEKAVGTARIRRAQAIGGYVARVAELLTRPHQVPAEGVEHAVYVARTRDAAILRAMVAARARREDALEAAIHRARNRDASLLRRAVRHALKGVAAFDATMPARRADGDGFGVSLGGFSLVEPANNNSRQPKAA